MILKAWSGKNIFYSLNDDKASTFSLDWLLCNWVYTAKVLKKLNTDLNFIFFKILMTKLPPFKYFLNRIQLDIIRDEDLDPFTGTTAQQYSYYYLKFI